eukprot:1975605-Amphidinium_carterae.2
MSLCLFRLKPWAAVSSLMVSPSHIVLAQDSLAEHLHCKAPPQKGQRTIPKYGASSLCQA